MYTKLGLSALMTVALASVAVGCGSSDNKKSTAAPASSATPAASSTTSSSSGGSSSAAAANPQLKAAVDACKQSISANTQVPANIKGDLNNICEKAGSGDANAVKDATKQVCLKIVKATVPDSAVEQASAACDSAG